MGKTALASGAVAYAKDRGAAAVWGTCWEGDGAPGFWPWIQVVRALAPKEGEDAAPGVHHLRPLQLRVPRQRRHVEPAVGLRDRLGRDPGEVDEHRRLGQAQHHQRHEALPTGDGAASRQ